MAPVFPRVQPHAKKACLVCSILGILRNLAGDLVATLELTAESIPLSLVGGGVSQGSGRLSGFCSSRHQSVAWFGGRSSFSFLLWFLHHFLLICLHFLLTTVSFLIIFFFFFVFVMFFEIILRSHLFVTVEV